MTFKIVSKKIDFKDYRGSRYQTGNALTRAQSLDKKRCADMKNELNAVLLGRGLFGCHAAREAIIHPQNASDGDYAELVYKDTYRLTHEIGGRHRVIDDPVHGIEVKSGWAPLSAAQREMATGPNHAEFRGVARLLKLPRPLRDTVVFGVFKPLDDITNLARLVERDEEIQKWK